MDLRVERTLRAIQESFVDLVLEIGFDKVTVRGLARRAQINPKTFYDHYADKYDLVDQLAQEFVNSYQQMLQVRFKGVKMQGTGLTLAPAPENIVSELVAQPVMKRLWLALSSIKFTGFDFEARVSQALAEYLQAAGITSDPLELDVISSCACKTMDYYFQTGERFSAERQKKLVMLLDALLAQS